MLPAFVVWCITVVECFKLWLLEVIGPGFSTRVPVWLVSKVQQAPSILYRSLLIDIRQKNRLTKSPVALLRVLCGWWWLMCSCFVSILEHALQTSASFCCNMSQPIMTYGWGAAKHPCPKAKHLWTSSEHLRNMEICFWLHRAIMIKGIQCQQKILQNDKNTKQTELSQHMDTGSSCLLLHVFEAKSMKECDRCARVKTQTLPNARSLRFNFQEFTVVRPR